MENTKEVAVKTNNAVAEIDPDFDASLFEGVDAKDIIIPKILLMQSVSKAVQEERNKTGEMLDSVTQQVICPREGTLEIVPLKMFKIWTINHIIKEKAVYNRTEPFGPHNATMPWEGEELDENGNPVKTRNVQGICCYVMLKKDLNDPSAFPYVVKFSSTSFKVGKVLTNHFTKAQMMKKNPYFKSLILGTAKESNEQNTWYVYTLAEGVPFSREQHSEELAVLKNWASTVNSASVKMDDSDEVKTAAEDQPPF